MNIRFLSPLLIIAAIFLFTTCATPVAPSGGPRDTTPPDIERSVPEDGTVNFDGRGVRIGFSKFINRSSLLNALEIEPDLAIGYDVSYGRTSATIEFDSDLPENTTVIFRIGTELQDTRGNNLASPYQLAVSTGPEIDDGQVTATVRRASDGSADSGYRVFLYREPFDLSARANYVAQTDTAGRVEFSYLAEDSYKAIWVDDTNRNRIWDWNREAAQPFYDSTFTLNRGDEYDLGTIYIDEPDTTRPELRGVGLLTEDRLRMRFNEEVYWDDDSLVLISDSLGNAYTEAYPLYALQEDPLVIIAQALEPLDENELFDIGLEGFYDSAGNQPLAEIDRFAGSAQADTVRLRIIGDNTIPGLYNDEPLTVGYNKFIDDDDVADSLRVVQGNTMIEDWPSMDIFRHRLTVSPAEEEWESGLSYQFLVWNPDREQLRPLEPVIWQRNDLGSVEVTLSDTTDSREYHLTLFDQNDKVRIDTTFTEMIEIDRLPPLSYTAIVFRDDDQTGRWTSGAIMPFQAPEPYYVRRNIPVREGFTSELDVNFNNQPTP